MHIFTCKIHFLHTSGFISSGLFFAAPAHTWKGWNGRFPHNHSQGWLLTLSPHLSVSVDVLCDPVVLIFPLNGAVSMCECRLSLLLVFFCALFSLFRLEARIVAAAPKPAKTRASPWIQWLCCSGTEPLLHCLLMSPSTSLWLIWPELHLCFTSTSFYL